MPGTEKLPNKFFIYFNLIYSSLGNSLPSTTTVPGFLWLFGGQWILKPLWSHNWTCWDHCKLVELKKTEAALLLRLRLVDYLNSRVLSSNRAIVNWVSTLSLAPTCEPLGKWEGRTPGCLRKSETAQVGNLCWLEAGYTRSSLCPSSLSEVERLGLKKETKKIKNRLETVLWERGKTEMEIQ